MVVKEPIIKLAAIDNGLAFPLKHPDSWRACESLRLCQGTLMSHTTVLGHLLQALELGELGLFLCRPSGFMGSSTSAEAVGSGC